MGTPVTVDSLSDVMDFGTVIRINPDETYDILTDIYAPDDVTDPEPYDNGVTGYDNRRWDFLDGFSGQYSYSGPVMHSSEYVGGSMAYHIIGTPGVYVSVIVSTPGLVCSHCGDEVTEDSETGTITHWSPGADEDHTPDADGDQVSGWAVLTMDGE